jgi:hypothetical protein
MRNGKHKKRRGSLENSIPRGCEGVREIASWGGVNRVNGFTLVNHGLG